MRHGKDGAPREQPAFAQDSATLMTNLPSDATAVTNYYKQNVHRDASQGTF